MPPIRIFLSSVQKELAEERAALRDYLRGDALMRRFFEVFLFEDLPAADRRADELYLEEVQRCDIYVGLFGYEYGSVGSEGTSPTEREFDAASAAGKYRLIYVKGLDDTVRHPQMRALVSRAQSELIRKRFQSNAELLGGLYAALIEYLERNERIRFGPFDAAPHREATLEALDPEKMAWFIRLARSTRRFPLPEDAPAEALLHHLNLLDHQRPTHAALLLFARQPQRWLISSELKCAHFHGTEVAKPIPSYQVYKGTVFELVDQAADFVLSKIALAVGTRAEGTRAPVRYELPKEVVAEAIVNAVAHRDYTSNGSVQVMLFADRLEVWNPGRLPPSLTLQKLREPHGSVPGNPLLAEPMYLAGYIERMGTGTGDMIRRCVAAGLPEPDFFVGDGFVTRIRRPEGGSPTSTSRGTPHETPQVTPHDAPHDAAALTDEVARLLLALEGEMTRVGLMTILGLRDRKHFTRGYLLPATAGGCIEKTRPDALQSRQQKYRLTELGRALRAQLTNKTEQRP